MYEHKKLTAIALAGLVLFIFSGCSSLMVVNERAISLEEIVSLSKADLSSDVIIGHIDATRSVFKLTSGEIIWLKEQGVDDEVIEYILETDIDTARFGWMYSTSPYDYWSNYSTSYYYPIYDYYFNRYSGYSYPYYYHHYYRPFYGGLSFYNNPYYVRRRPGLVGRFYEYAPSIPVYERDFPVDQRLRFRDSNNGADDSDEKSSRSGRGGTEDSDDSGKSNRPTGSSRRRAR